ncbi:MAG: hypothetical protein AAFY31_16350, partial [Pseudomonadota bacterium]
PCSATCRNPSDHGHFRFALTTTLTGRTFLVHSGIEHALAELFDVAVSAKRKPPMIGRVSASGTTGPFSGLSDIGRGS